MAPFVRIVGSFPSFHPLLFCVACWVPWRLPPPPVVLLRAGDRVVATSATLGDVLWEKNTVDGILSAVGTRLLFSNTVTLRVERALDAQQLAAAR